MRIPEETINAIIEKADIVEVISEYVKLEKKGNDYKGICPFHNDTNPSFSVSPAKKVYKCFSCNEAGGVVKFVQKIRNVSFLEAIKILGDKYNIKVDIKGNEYSENLKKYYNIMQEATETYEFYLNNTKEGEAALEYLHGRHLDDDIIKRFQIGLSSSKDNIICKALIDTEKFLPLDLKEINLIGDNNGKYFDLFRERVMFPIKNLNGNIIAFSGRLYKEGKPKYINSSESLIFKKGQILYNYFESQNDIKLQNHVFVFEGFMDVIAAYRCGINNTVATMGTALTNEQINAIKKLTNNVVLCYDGDEPGIEATKRAIRLFINAGMNVKVVLMPDGLDPDEFINKYGNDGLNKYLRTKSLSSIEYLYEVEKRKLNIHDSNSIISFQNNVYTFLKFFNSKSLESIVLDRMAKDLNLKKEDLEADLDKKEEIIPVIDNSKKITLTQLKKLKYSFAEKGLIYLAYNRKDDCDEINRLLGYGGSFTKKTHRNILYKLFNYYSFSNVMDSTIFFNQLDDEELDDLKNIINSFNVFTITELKDLVDTVLEYSNERVIQDIKAKINEQQQLEDKDVMKLLASKKGTIKFR